MPRRWQSLYSLGFQSYLLYAFFFTCIGWMESVSGSVSESESKGAVMGFGHEKLNVYREAIEYVGWAYLYCEMLKGHRNAKDQLLRASQAIPIVWI